jgi:type I restriction enzyme, R subunit
MTTQFELALEEKLIKQLEGLEYERIKIEGEADLIANLKTQLELHNDLKFSEAEFKRILNHLNKGGVFDRAKTLRERWSLQLDDGTRKNIEFLNMSAWCQNTFQVTNQVSQEGDYKNRYDVTILINGIPLAQIELKRRGGELKEAFNQVNRYRRHSFASGVGLYQYIQLFIISNGVNTKYYSNTVGYQNPDKSGSFKFTSFWADKENRHITELEEFTKVFLEPCHLAKMITKYMVLNTEKTLLALRPYQYYAVEAIEEKVKSGSGGGYIWHTTGSGKTLTSFKASQLLIENPEVHKVVFVVDRNDLDNQTIREFNSFKEGSVDATTNTKNLVKQFTDPNAKLIVTTIQKLNTAITRDRHTFKMDALKDKKIIFIFDECHRSQFGETHKRITEYFTNHQLFGFTGTPIFEDNASGNGLGKRTTKNLFGECLHKYVITDAIKDENVLKFSVEYVGRYKKKQSANEVDIEVEAIDTAELFQSDERIDKITDYIIANHNRKTHSKEFTAIFATPSKEILMKYYDSFKLKQQQGKHNLRIATIFSYGANEDDQNADGLLDEEINLEQPEKVNKHSREKLEEYIADYNKMFGTSYSTKDSNSFYHYYRNIADRVKAREVDILLVVNMFLTGFDSKTLNTLYVDKNLKYHGLIQAYSRTNRILNATKSQGNIVVFRNLKSATDEALQTFANKAPVEDIFLEPYEDYLEAFNTKLKELENLTPNPADVSDLGDEEQILQFVQNFRELLRLKNILISFADFKLSDLNISEQTFDNFKSKYLDIRDKAVNPPEKVSILEEVDFELELIKKDEVNVSYILSLIASMVGANEAKRAEIAKSIASRISSDPSLRSKQELIEKFIQNNIPNIQNSGDVENEFYEYWNQEQTEAFQKLCQEEGIDKAKAQNLIDRYLFSKRMPQEHDLDDIMLERPSILKLNSAVKNIKTKLTDYIRTFIDEV